MYPNVSADAPRGPARRPRKEKLGDDLDRMVDWWRAHKEAEHGKLRAQQSG